MDICGNEINQIYFDCKSHKGFKPQLLSLNINPQENKDNIFLCGKCINKTRYNQQKFEDYVSIDDLLNSDEQTIFSKWPPLKNQKLLFGINSLLEDESKCVNYQTDVVSAYFDSLKEEINQHIDHVKKQMLIQCDQIPQLEEQFMKCYNQIAEKERVKDLLLTPNLDISQASAKMNELLELKNKQKEENEDLILKVYTPYFKQLSSFDSYNPKILKERIISMIQSINFFPDLVDKQQGHTNPDNNNISKDTTLVYEKMDQNAEDNFLSPQQKFLLELINSPSNYLTKEFSEKITVIMKQSTPFFEDLDMSNCTLQNKVPINFNWLRMEQVELIEKLVNKMKEIEYSDEMSYEILQSLPNTQSALSLFDRQSEDIDQLMLLLQHYPILEFMKRDFTFVKSYFDLSSQFLEMEVIENGAIKFIKVQQQCYSTTILSNLYLERNKTYKIKFELIPFSADTEYSYCIGLTSKGQTRCLHSDKISLCIDNCHGISNSIRMDKLKKGDKNAFKLFKQFELKVNQSNGVFEIADSSYSNITEMEELKKREVKSDTHYQIGFSIFNPGDALIIQNIQINDE